MNSEKQFLELTDFQITKTMIDKGGGFVSRLGQLYRHADDDNQAKLKEAFADYWYKYAAMTRRCPECGRTEILNRHHDGQTGGVPECDFYQCEDCDHQWGHREPESWQHLIISISEFTHEPGPLRDQ